MRAGDAANRLKILVIGPVDTGKSVIANVLAEAAESVSEVYRPTVAVRILESETELRSSAQRVTVELWDVSGDYQKYQKCWPAIKKDTAGVILVYNPEKDTHDAEAVQWYGWFPKSMGLSPNQVMVLQSLRSVGPRRMPLPEKLVKVGCGAPHPVLADDIVSVRKHFAGFVETVRQTVLDKQRQEEDDVMKAN